MIITGVDAVTFGVDDMAEALRFLRDWGLEEREVDGSLLHFTTQDGGEVFVRAIGDSTLPAAMQDGPTLRQVTWGVVDATALDAIAVRLGKAASVDTQGVLTTLDPNGLSHAFRVSRCTPVIAAAQAVNGPGAPNRVDRRAPIFDQARPLSIGHVVLFVDDLDATLSFFLDTLGFIVSDSYPGHAAFLRCVTPGPHHHAFVLRRPGKPGLNHVAFTVNTINEVFGGGLAMSRKGWDTEIGPGRHPISSAYFWYFKSPFGASLEYYADDDYCTEAWVAGEFERRPDLFAEWAIAGGIDGNTRRQVRAA